VVVVESKEWPTVPDLRKHVTVIEKFFKAKPVLVFERRAPRRLNLLVKNNIPYIYLENEVYLPFLTLKLKAKEIEPHEVMKPSLKGIPQVIMTHQLIHEDLDRLSVSEIARRLRLIKMSVSRALIQLEATGLCRSETFGRSKKHIFPSKKELWQLVQNLMENPINRTIYVEKLSNQLDLVKSGVSALAESTLIDDMGEQTFAVHSKKVKTLKLEESLEETIKLEIWDWNPQLTALKGVADPISTYYSLLNTEDERIALARDEYLATIGLDPIHKDS